MEYGYVRGSVCVCASIKHFCINRQPHSNDNVLRDTEMLISYWYTIWNLELEVNKLIVDYGTVFLA